FAKIDHHRALRKGFPEVVFCQGKTTEQILSILRLMRERHATVLATRASEEVARAVQEAFPEAEYNPRARTLVIRSPAAATVVHKDHTVLVVCAGTADIPVAEEAVVTAETMGCHVERLYDVGVAGIHRLLDHSAQLASADVIIVVAGMEGALPSVVGGLVHCPVIAVPTSVGYGASFQGLAALLTMLNCCAPGVVVVNIDNGFGAGYFASIIVKKS
ncbi:MAG: nickel pincer cofactor biosynthesis protein LarB, partial [Abditibacteriales bacterium]|nr:nickel pincer cofactor biosynthesis protein LarB [Abditibacteriales bacterium]